MSQAVSWHLRIFFLACIAFLSASDATATGVSPDAALKSRLVGSWTGSETKATPRELFVMAHGFFIIERFDADGTGEVTAFRGKLCGTAMRTEKFTWDIKNGMLISGAVGMPTDRDRIIGITKDEFTFFSSKNRVVEARSRTLGCVTS